MRESVLERSGQSIRGTPAHDAARKLLEVIVFGTDGDEHLHEGEPRCRWSGTFRLAEGDPILVSLVVTGEHLVPGTMDGVDRPADRTFVLPGDVVETLGHGSMFDLTGHVPIQGRRV